MAKPTPSESLPSRAANSELELARRRFSERAWERAFEHFWSAARAEPCELELDDLEQAAITAALTGRDTEFLGALERVHAAALTAGAPRRGARAGLLALAGVEGARGAAHGRRSAAGRSRGSLVADASDGARRARAGERLVRSTPSPRRSGGQR